MRGRRSIYTNGGEMAAEIHKNHLRITVGPSDYKKLITESDIFVDKSFFIKEIIDSGEEAILITYPRRWGKTLNLDMLKTFFEPELEDGKPKLHEDQKNRQIFEKLNIGKGGYADTNEIAYRISLLKNDSNLVNDTDKYIEIVKYNSFLNKDYILQNCKVDREAKNQLKVEIKKYVLSLKQKFSDIGNLEDLISEYHKASDKEAVASNINNQVLKQEKTEKFELLRKSIEDKIEQWKENNPKKYQEIKQEFDLIGKNQGKYPAIFLSLKDVVGRTVKDIESKLRLEISTLFSKYEYLLTPIKEKQEKSSTDIRNLRKFDNLVQETATEDELKDSIRFLSELLYKHHGERVYILVDEYDKPVNYLMEQSLTNNIKESDDISKLITSIMSSCGKGNEYLNKIILTGIFDTFQKEGGSGFNNLSVYGITSGKFSKSFGFSEDEIEILLKQLSFGEDHNLLKDNIKKWYDGYTVPIGYNQTISAYTPWAVMKYLNSAYNGNYQPENYWVQTGASKMFEALLKNEECAETPFINSLLSITTSDHVTLKYDKAMSLFKYDLNIANNEESIFSYLLLNSGYLTSVKQNHTHITLSIPNYEVKEELKRVFNIHVDTIRSRKGDICKKIQKGFTEQNTEYSFLNFATSIIEQDLGNLEKYLDKVKDISPQLTIKPLHLSALSANHTIFEAIANEYKKDVFEKSHNLTIADYAYMSANQKLFDYVKITYNSQLSVTLPNNMDYIICPVDYISNEILSIIATAGFATITASLSGAINNIPQVITNHPYLFGITSITLLTPILYVKMSDYTAICSNYYNYGNIRTHTPITQYLDSFIKYRLSHNETSYVKLGSNCNNEDIKISQFDLDIAESTIVETSKTPIPLSITLCSTHHSKEELETKMENKSAPWIKALVCMGQLATLGAIGKFSYNLYQISGTVLTANGAPASLNGPLVAANNVAKFHEVKKLLISGVAEGIEVFFDPYACPDTLINAYGYLYTNTINDETDL